MSGERCANCKFFGGYEGMPDDAKADCRFHPPQPPRSPYAPAGYGYSMMDSTAYQRWPEVYPWMFCGEFKTRPVEGSGRSLADAHKTKSPPQREESEGA